TVLLLRHFMHRALGRRPMLNPVVVTARATAATPVEHRALHDALRADVLNAACAKHGLATTFLTAPTTPAKRLAAIARRARGFVYHVSRTGVTGEQSELSGTLGAEVQLVKAAVKPPVVVGFGLSTPQQVREVCGIADGAVVGSAIVRRTLQDKPLSAMLQDIRELVVPLVEATR
ncbi:MAG TPA: tryptophan synthase subunit alpha, partial [Fibrobacteria bacterium]|nr:tryptophan synthase subunit alpha [Fibrobacteria bacterium]